MPKTYLAQSKPGNWHITHHLLPNIPVPSWLVDEIGRDDRNLLCKALTDIWVSGRVYGQGEGEEKVLREVRKALRLGE